MRPASIWLVVLLAAGGSLAAEGTDYAGFAALAASGDRAGALEAGGDILAQLKAARPRMPELESMEKRLGAIADSAGLTVYKLDMIAESAGMKAASPFLFVVPRAGELLRDVQGRFTASRPFFRNLSDAESNFARSYVELSLARADEQVTGSYLAAMQAGLSEKAGAEARSYLSAYMIAAHDESNYDKAFKLLADSVSEGQLPAFLAADAVKSFGDVRAAVQVMNALDAVAWAAWPEGERMRLLKEVGDKAREKGENEWAISAYSKLSSAGEGAEAEEAQKAVIGIYADAMKDYANAAAACGDYVERFPSSDKLIEMQYRKALYEYQANNFDAALADLGTFKQENPDSSLMASVMLLEGMSYTGKGKLDEAVKVFTGIIEKYPRDRQAGRAQFLIGFALLSSQKYAEAKEAFQRVVDFYPNDSYAPQARDYLNKLSNIPGATNM